ncbi:MAG: carboxypeptidase-like regulatory domain-containing protein [Tannerella sp.]|jgi:TonB-dependent SusC/RagA subfamily outer membrane receptor|nr:carboxypeptidase-like regulatory domain-containing protein [Tannerella sp.]
METFGLYSLKAGILLALFWGIYHVCLQKETFYRFNRFFLLLGMGIALILPLYSVHYIIEVRSFDPTAFLIANTDYAATVTATNEQSVLLQICYRLLSVIYITGICILLIFRFFGLSRLFAAIRKNRIKRYVNYNLIESPDFQGAFSFFRYIFISGQLLENEKRIILKHEEAHIRQKHWVDLLLINLLNLFWWFNPVIWLYEKAIRNNHEYLADQAVLTDHEQAEYQKTLVNQWFKVPVFPVSNSYSYSNQLKRINMMKKNNSSPVKQLFALLSIPALALFMWAFAEPEYVVKTSLPEIVNSVSEDSVKVIGYATNNPLAGLKKLNEEPLIVIDGVKSDKTTNDIEQIDPAQISEMHVLKDGFALEKYGEEGKNGVIEITTLKAVVSVNNKQQEGTAFKPPYPKNTNLITFPKKESPLVIVDNEKTNQNINTIDPANIFSLSVIKDKESLKVYGEEGRNGVVKITTLRGRKTLLDQSGIEIEGHVVDENNNPIQNATVVVHGTETITSTDNKGKFSLRVSPEDCIRIYADNYSMVNLFPDIKNKQQQTIQLKRDLDLIEVKNPEPETHSSNKTENLLGLNGNPLVIINGEIADKTFEEFHNMNPENIASITVLKDKSAVDLYGEKAKDGVILLTTKQ